MVKRFLTAFCIFLVTLAVGNVSAQDFPAQPSPPRLVNDFAGLMTPSQEERLEAKLTEFDRQTSTQIAVVTVDDLQGYDAGDYAQRLHDKWGVGRSGKNNGILILVKPKTTDSKGEVFISVGYGLEGVVPDITAGRIIDSEMLPSFMDGDMYTGIDRAADVLMGLTKGEFTADQYNSKKNTGDFAGAIIMLIIFFIIVSIANRSSKHRNDDDNNSSGGRGGWIPPIIIGGGRGGGGFGGFGGGFGGFGGGSSGGGGGGRSW